MEQVRTLKMNRFNKLKSAAAGAPAVLLSMAFVVYGVLALTVAPALLEMVAVLNMPHEADIVALVLIGVVNIEVAILLLFKDKIFQAIPWKYIFIYAGLWPVVPGLLQWMGGHPFAWVESLAYIALAISAHHFQRRRTIDEIEQSIYQLI